MIASLAESIERLSEIERNQKLLLEQIKQLVADRDAALNKSRKLKWAGDLMLDVLVNDHDFNEWQKLKRDATEEWHKAKMS